MLFPDEKIIFKIPIYSMPEKKFNHKWEKQKKWIDDSMGWETVKKRARQK